MTFFAVALFFAAVIALIVVHSHVRLHLRAILLAAAAATPDSAILLLALNGHRPIGWLGWLAAGVFTMVPCFIVCFVAVTILGTPLAWTLQKVRRTTAAMYMVAGASAPLVLYGIYCLYDWIWVESGPFSMSLRDQMAFEGARRVITRLLFTGGSLSLSGALAAYVYRLSMRSSTAVGEDGDVYGGRA